MSDDRTQQPTAKRRQQARQEGRVVASSQVVGVVIWLAFAASLFFMGGSALALVRQGIECVWGEPWNFSAVDLDQQLRHVLVRLLIFTIPMFGAILGLAILARLAQVGVVWAPSRLTPEMNRLNPGQRLGSLLSADKFVQFVRGAGLVVCALSLMSFGIWSQRDTLIGLVAAGDFEGDTVRLLSGWGLRMGGCLVVFAAADYSYQRYRFELGLQMSPDEVRAEVKAVEGNPQVAAKRKSIQRQLNCSREN